MRFFSSNRQRPRQLLGFTLACVALSSCALGLDFDSLSNACNSPKFDIPGFDQFCSGELVRLADYQPAGVGGADERVEPMRLDQEGTLLAIAAISVKIDSSDPSCLIYSPIINLAHVNDGGDITDLGSMVGDEYGLEFRLSSGTQTCEREDINAFWVTEVEIVSSSPIQVLAAFGDGGLVSVIFSGDGRVLSVHQLAGSGSAAIQRTCVAGACVAGNGQYCADHSDCHYESFCNAASRCQPLAECSLDSQCRIDDQTCANRRGTCAVTCRKHSDCPHPLSCIDEICGGEGCDGDLICVSGDPCRFGQCQPFCSLSEECDEDLACFVTTEPIEFICAPGGTAGICFADTDCSIGAVTGFAVLPANPITNDVSGLAVATYDRGVRWAAWSPGVHPYFLPADETSEGLQIFDVLWVEDYGALYGTVPELGLVRFDLGKSIEDGGFDEERHLHLHPLSLDPDAPLTEIVRVGNNIVTTEGGIAVVDSLDPVDTLSRVLALNDDPSEDLEQLAIVNLGVTLQPLVSTIEGYPDIWMWGVDRPDGGEVLFFDVRNIANADVNATQLTSSGVLQTTTSAQRNWVQVVPQGAFFGSSIGLTLFELELQGAFQ